MDVLRGSSIAVVLLLHFTLAYRLIDSPMTRIVPPGWLNAIVRNGNYGVTLFFAISGYLITSLSMQRFQGLGSIRPTVFFRLRVARIMPSLLLALSIIVTLGSLGLSRFQNHGAGAPGYAAVVLSVLTFWHNVQMAFHRYFNYCVNIFWSLSVEEVFYLGFPFACSYLKRRRWIMALCLLAIVVGPVYRYRHADDEIFFMYGYLACFDAIAFGCLAALFQEWASLPGRWGRVLEICAALLVSITYLRGIAGHEVLGFTWIALGGALLLWSSKGSDRGWLSARRGLGWLRWLGRHSYELYLFHIIVLGVLLEIVPPKALAYGWKPAWLVVFTGLSVCVAWAVARYWSEPMNRWIRGRECG